MRLGSPPNFAASCDIQYRARAHVHDLLGPFPLRCVPVIDGHDEITSLGEVSREPFLAARRAALPGAAVDLHDDGNRSARRRLIDVKGQRHAVSFRKLHVPRHADVTRRALGGASPSIAPSRDRTARARWEAARPARAPAPDASPQRHASGERVRSRRARSAEMMQQDDAAGKKDRADFRRADGEWEERPSAAPGRRSSAQTSRRA